MKMGSPYRPVSLLCAAAEVIEALLLPYLAILSPVLFNAYLQRLPLLPPDVTIISMLMTSWCS